MGLHQLHSSRLLRWIGGVYIWLTMLFVSPVRVPVFTRLPFSQAPQSWTLEDLRAPLATNP